MKGIKMTITFDKRWTRIIIMFQISLVLAAFTGGMLADRWMGSSQSQFPVLQEAIGILHTHALFDLPPTTKMEHSMIRGLVSALDDPYTSFVEPPQHELQSARLAGQYGGIGALLELDKDGLFLLYPYPDSPAYKAGVQDGDRLLAVNGWQITPETTRDEVEASLHGVEGEKVTLAIFRKSSDEQMTIDIRRVSIPIPSVTWNVTEENEQVGIIRINVIAKTTPDEIKKAVHDLSVRGVSAYILDLRDNSGGLVEAGVDIARLFLETGTIIEQQYRGQPVKAYAVERVGELADIPLVVFVNGGTASAAEIVAGALQAQRRAIIIGSHTYGKDTIQLVFDLKDQSSLHVTAARWWVPGLSQEQAGKGIVPDIQLPADQIDSPVIVHEAIKLLVQ
jgi:carboxyl-terminal processing protease